MAMVVVGATDELVSVTVVARVCVIVGCTVCSTSMCSIVVETTVGSTYRFATAVGVYSAVVASTKMVGRSSVFVCVCSCVVKSVITFVSVSAMVACVVVVVVIIGTTDVTVAVNAISTVVVGYTVENAVVHTVVVAGSIVSTSVGVKYEIIVCVDTN